MARGMFNSTRMPEDTPSPEPVVGIPLEDADPALGVAIAEDSSSADQLRPPSRSSLLRSAVIIAFATVGSRVGGLAREATITALFGAGVVTDAFYMAYMIPDMLRVLVLSGILSVIFIPLYADLAVREGVDRAKRMSGQFLTLTLLVGSACTIFGILSAPVFIAMTKLISPPSPDQNPELMPLATYLTRLLFPILMFTGLSGLLQSVLNSLHDYKTAAFAPIWFNVVFVVLMWGIAWTQPEWLTGEMLALASIAGMVVQVVVQLPALRRLGVWFEWPQLRDAHWVRFVRDLPAAFIGYAALVTNSFVDRAFAFGMGEVTTTAQFLSIRLQQLPIGIIAVTLVTALFPSIAQKVSLDKREEASEDFYLALRLCAMSLLPATAFLAVWCTPIVRLLFNSGKFAEVPANLHLTADGTLAYALATFPLGVGLFTTRLFFAVQDRTTPVRLGLIAIAINYVADWILVKVFELGLMGLALSSTIVSSFVFFFGLFALRQRLPGITQWGMRHETWRVLALSALYALAAWGVARGVDATIPLLSTSSNTTPKWADLLYLLSALVGSLLFLVGGAALLKVEEVKTLARVLRKRKEGAAAV